MSEPHGHFIQRLRTRLWREYTRMSGRVRWTISASHPRVSVSDHQALLWRMGHTAQQSWDTQICPDEPTLSALRSQAADLMRHQFNLLGSGPVVVHHGSQCQGLNGHCYDMPRNHGADAEGQWIRHHINRSNQRESRRIWSMLGPGYTAIDWQLDFKSGYRWPERQPSSQLRFAHLPGIDVKVPWELARMQHLPVLALACRAAQAGHEGFLESAHYRAEIRNQLLDFLASNPPGFGVNWICAMDVGIRIANILFALDLIGGTDSFEDDAFAAIISAAVRAHGDFLSTHLEWAPKHRGNHYLANIAGLLFCGAYLPASPQADLWLHFGTCELMSEIDRQFHPDGSNFEGSTSYHRLSAEIVLWSLSLLSNLAEEKRQALLSPRVWPGPIPPQCRLDPFHHDTLATCHGKLQAMGEFTKALTRPDGCIVQFGDNDSGRFIPACSIEQCSHHAAPSSPCWNLDHSALIHGIDALLGRHVTGHMGRVLQIYADIQTAAHPPIPASSDSHLSCESVVWEELLKLSLDCPPGSMQERIFIAESPLSTTLVLASHPGMGCYVFRSDYLYLAIRCGEIGMNGLGAHDHCDQLGIELVIEGRDLIRDPGTYLYTPLPAERNTYRSATVHGVPHVQGREPANLNQGLFNLSGSGQGECLYFGTNGFVGRHRGYGQWVYRLIAIRDHSLLIRDFSPEGLTISDPMPEAIAYSPGYGLICTSSPSR